MRLDGSCQCGKVTFRVESETPYPFMFCYCSICRKSRSTEEYDRGDRFDHYKRMRSIKQYVLVSHRERSVEVWNRDEKDHWTSTVVHDGDVALLESVHAKLDVRELYEAAAEPS